MHLIRRSLERGDLVRVLPDIRKPREMQHLTWRASRDLSPAAAAFRDWIVAEARAERITQKDLPPVYRAA